MPTAEWRVTRNESFDSLSALEHLLHVREVRYEQHRGTHWATEGETGCSGVPFQIVTCRACAIDLIDAHRSVRLEPGDVAVFPRGGNRHIVRGRSELPEGLRDIETQLVGGRFVLEPPRDNPVLAALPDLIVVREAEHAEAPRLRRLISAIGDELDAGRAGAHAIASGLASVLFMMIVRIHLDRECVVEGLLRILSHRQAAHAVEAMLSSPSRAWTLDELANHASTSRASLVRMFRKTVRMAPLEFLAELRLGLARHTLSATNLPLAQIAAEIGYLSESSFSRAFRRRFGMSPGGARASCS